MAVRGIRPVQSVQTTQSGKKGGSKLGAGLGAIIGGIAGGAAAGPGGAAVGAAKGAIGGATLGQSLFGMAAPGRPEISETTTSAQAALSSTQEAIRGQQLLQGLQAAQSIPELANYAEPLTQAYIASMSNIKKMEVQA